MSKIKNQTEILLALHRIEDRLQEIAEILKVGHRETIKATQRKVLAGSPLRKKIYDLCNGSRSVSQIAEILGKSVQQVSNNIVLLQNAGLIKEVRKGKEKFYIKSR
jgi:DNA-binding transcriptional ArsR family regulator